MAIRSLLWARYTQKEHFKVYSCPHSELASSKQGNHEESHAISIPRRRHAAGSPSA